jgi:hypothetical protein
MSDTTNEAEGLGAADPITGVVAGGDDLDADTQLPDDDDAQDRDEVQAEENTVATNDAVAGETVLPGSGEGNDGPTGGAPSEITPDSPDLELRADGADLNSQHEAGY